MLIFCTNFHFQPQSSKLNRVPVAPHPHQHFTFSLFQPQDMFKVQVPNSTPDLTKSIPLEFLSRFSILQSPQCLAKWSWEPLLINWAQQNKHLLSFCGSLLWIEWLRILTPDHYLLKNRNKWQQKVAGRGQVRRISHGCSVVVTHEAEGQCFLHWFMRG